MIVVEFQMQHAYGFDSFMKIAHMALGEFVLFLCFEYSGFYTGVQ